MIRPATIQDFSFVYECYMHPQVNPYLLYEFMDTASFQPIFDELVQQGIKYIYSRDNENIGMFKLIPLQHRSHHIAYLGGLAIHPSFFGRGEGLTMLQEIVALAGEKGFLRIELTVGITNKRAVKLYEKVGFEKEGVLRKLTHLISEQRFVDEVMMSFLF